MNATPPTLSELRMTVQLARVLSASSERLLEITEDLLARHEESNRTEIRRRSQKRKQPSNAD